MLKPLIPLNSHPTRILLGDFSKKLNKKYFFEAVIKDYASMTDEFIDSCSSKLSAAKLQDFHQGIFPGLIIDVQPLSKKSPRIAEFGEEMTKSLKMRFNFSKKPAELKEASVHEGTHMLFNAFFGSSEKRFTNDIVEYYNSKKINIFSKIWKEHKAVAKLNQIYSNVIYKPAIVKSGEELTEKIFLKQLNEAFDKAKVKDNYEKILYLRFFVKALTSEQYAYKNQCNVIVNKNIGIGHFEKTYMFSIKLKVLREELKQAINQERTLTSLNRTM